MARQATAAVSFSRTVRSDDGVLLSSGRAGDVRPAGFIPLLRGDSASGRVSFDVSLAEMPRPLLNAAFLNVQAWFVPKSSHPRFAGIDEFMHAYTGENITALGQTGRVPPNFFDSVVGTAFAGSDFCKALGLHLPAGVNINTDLIDAFVQVYNFRLAAHSSRLVKKQYYAQSAVNAMAFPRAFWPTGRFSKVVPDYERALIIGSMDLDITAGRIPLRGLHVANTGPVGGTYFANDTGQVVTSGTPRFLTTDITVAMQRVYADMQTSTINASLADIDMARTGQAFAKLRASMAGNDVSGFNSDSTLLAHLMQGLSVPEEQFNRPWLLDSKRVPFGFQERFATDAANLDDSVTTGQARVEMQINVPQNDVGGLIIFTMEVLPERLDERQSDEWLQTVTVAGLPNALRDVQNPEPVDQVINRRLDAAHVTPAGLYGYEPMNDKWNRSVTRLGGVFYQPNPTLPVTAQRSAIWQANIVNPVFSADHFLAPAAFPHTVFSDTLAPAYESVVRHSVKIVGLTQIGDVLNEANDDLIAVRKDTIYAN